MKIKVTNKIYPKIKLCLRDMIEIVKRLPEEDRKAIYFIHPKLDRDWDVSWGSGPVREFSTRMDEIIFEKIP